MSGRSVWRGVAQMELHPFWVDFDVVDWCQDRGVRVMASSPLARTGEGGGARTRRSTGPLGDRVMHAHLGLHPPAAHPPCYLVPAAPSRPPGSDLLKEPFVIKTASTLGVSPAQVVLRWAVQQVRGPSGLTAPLGY